MTRPDLVIRNVEVRGLPGLDVAISGGRIAGVGPALDPGDEQIDGAGGALIPGLIDHHIHLLATAARAESLVLDGVTTASELAAKIADHAAARPPGTWLRAIGYHERMAGELTLGQLDRLAPHHPLRLQHQTGALWMLNSLALDRVAYAAAPACLERDAAGRPTGNVWRGDRWLRERIGDTIPSLAGLGRSLAALGVTGVMDASATTDDSAAGVIARAARGGDLPQRVGLMSAGPLNAPADGAFRIGPLKVLLDDRALIALDDFEDRIRQARAWGRAVAVHCVTEGELALTLAAFQAAGSRPGDRIEHGGLIGAEAIPVLRDLGLTVVTQPIFVRERGDRYLAEVDPDSHADLYRCRALLGAGVPLAASSDAPYGSPDPWAAIGVCVNRLTRSGQPLGPNERVGWRRALDLYLGGFSRPGGKRRGVRPGAPADLCLLKTPLRAALASPDAGKVAATLVGGRLVYRA